MTTQQKAAPGWHREAAQKSNSAASISQGPAFSQALRLPPFARQLRPRPDRTLLVITGKSGWSLFDRGGTTNAILLPDPDPSLYRWPDLSGWADGLLIDVDGTLTSDETKALAVALLAAGLPRVVTDLATFARRVS
ncbi:hypothetical protein ABZN20_10150 [Methylococcus sp. ANG]|uniref:hypothetical protein n=1 Tax=Methylococcus sp. ANG TaxID=3231903 RepID=UPI00345A1C1C